MAVRVRPPLTATGNVPMCKIDFTRVYRERHESVDCVQTQMAVSKRGVYIILCEAFCTWPPTRELHYITVPLYPANLSACIATLPTPVITSGLWISNSALNVTVHAASPFYLCVHF